MCNTAPDEGMYHVNWRLMCMVDRGGTRRLLELGNLVQRETFTHAKHNYSF